MKTTYPFVLFVIGYIIIIVAALLVMLDYHQARYAFAGGTLFLIIGRYLTLPSPDNFRIKRLNNLLAIGALSLIATCYFMFRQNNAWIITLTIAAFIDLYTSFRYPKKKDVE